MTASNASWLALLLVGVLIPLSCRPAPRVVIATAEGKRITIDVEVADSPARRAMGLQYRTELKDHQGMLFLFPAASVQAFWMKNTPLSLDLIFIGNNRTIVGIVREATPFSTATLAVSSPSQFVLEVRGGLSRRWGVGVGDRVGFENISLDGIR